MPAKKAPQKQGDYAAGLSKVIAKAAGLFFVAILFSKLANYAFRWVGTRLGPAEYGVFSLAFAAFDVTCTLAMFGVDSGLARLLPEQLALSNRRKALNVAGYSLRTAVLVSLAAGLVLFILAPFISSSLLSEPKVADPLRVLAFAVPFTIVCMVLVTIARSMKRVDAEAAAKHFTESGTRPVFAAIALGLGLGAAGISGAVLVSSILACAVAFAFVFRVFFTGNANDLFSAAKRATQPAGFHSFSGWIYLSNLSAIWVSWGAVFALGIALGAREAGIFNAALPLATFALIPSIAIPVLLGTVMIELETRKDRTNLLHAYRNVTKSIVLVTLPIALFLAVFSTQLLFVLFGPDYAAGASALMLLALGYFFFSIGASATSLLFALRHSRLLLYTSLASAAVLLAGLFLLVPPFGLLGAAFANGLAIATQGLFPLLAAWRVSGMHPFTRNLGKTVLSGILAGFCALGVSLAINRYIYSMAAGAVAFCVAYGLFLFLLRAFDEADLELLKAVERRTGIRLGSVRDLLKGYYRGK